MARTQIQRWQIADKNLTGASFVDDIKIYSETNSYNPGDIVWWKGKFWIAKQTISSTEEGDLSNAPSESSNLWKPYVYDQTTPSQVVDYIENTNNIDITNTQNPTIDGIQVQPGDRVFLNAQTDQTENGFYIVDSNGYLQRDPIFPQGGSCNGVIFSVKKGNTYSGALFVVKGGDDIGTDNINATEKTDIHAPGNNQEVIFNDNSLFGTDSNFKYDKNINELWINKLALRGDSEDIYYYATSDTTISSHNFITFYNGTNSTIFKIQGDVSELNSILRMYDHRIIDVQDPVDPQDAATKHYVDSQLSSQVPHYEFTNGLNEDTTTDPHQVKLGGDLIEYTEISLHNNQIRLTTQENGSFYVDISNGDGSSYPYKTGTLSVGSSGNSLTTTEYVGSDEHHETIVNLSPSIISISYSHQLSGSTNEKKIFIDRDSDGIVVYDDINQYGLTYLSDEYFFDDSKWIPHKQYIDARANTVVVTVMTTSNIDVNNPPSTIDGVSLNTNDIIAAFEQTNSSEEGFYVYTGSGNPLYRNTYLDGHDISGLLVSVQKGTQHGGKVYKILSPAVLGTDDITYTEISSGYQFENGLTVDTSTSPNTVKLGGHLTDSNTILYLDNFLTLRSNGSGSFYQFWSSGVSFEVDSQSDPIIKYTIKDTFNDGVIIGAKHNTSGDVDYIQYDTTNGFVITTELSSKKGLSYAADYSADNSSNPRWIPDKAYVDNLFAGGVSWKQPVRALSDSNIDITNPPTSIDGVTLNNGDRIALFNQSTYSEDGVYIYNGSGNALTRADDWSVGDNCANWTFWVQEGDNYRDTQWTVTNDKGSDIIGTNDINIVQIAGQGLYNFTNGLTKVGNNIKLGGHLIENTSIDVSEYSLYIQDETSTLNGVFIGRDGTHITYTTSGSKLDHIYQSWQYWIRAHDTLTDENNPIDRQIEVHVQGTVTYENFLVKYYDDYSSQYDNRTLVDKEYVDNQIQASIYNYDNGLQIISGTVEWGGTLNHQTTIDVNNQLLQIYDVSNSPKPQLILDARDGYESLSLGVMDNLDSGYGHIIRITKPRITIVAGPSGPSDGAGLYYDADYSSLNTTNDRWIPDKAYVDNAISNNTSTYTFENGLTDSVNGNDHTVNIGGSIIHDTALDGQDSYSFSFDNFTSIALRANLITSRNGSKIGKLGYFVSGFDQYNEDFLYNGAFNRLAFAIHQGYTVNWITPPASGSDYNLFNGKANWVTWDTNTNNPPWSFEIDLNGEQWSYMRHLVLYFSASAYPKYIKIEYYKNGSWNTYSEISDNNSNTYAIATGSEMYSTEKLRFTFDNPNNGSSVQLTQVVWTSYYVSPTPYAIYKGGDDVYGELNMHNHKITGLPIPTDNTDATNKEYVDQQISNAVSNVHLSDIIIDVTKDWQNYSIDNLDTLYARRVVTDATYTNFGSDGSIKESTVFTSNANGTYYSRAHYIVTQKAVSSGITDNGYIVDLYLTNMANSDEHVHAGTLNHQYGVLIQYGLYKTNHTGTINSSYGIAIYPYSDSGTITNNYGLYIDDPTNVSNVTNYYPLYIDSTSGISVIKSETRIQNTLDMSNHRIINVATPQDGTDAVNKDYVDNAVNNFTAGSDKQVIYNNSGTLVGDNSFIWDYNNYIFKLGSDIATPSEYSYRGIYSFNDGYDTFIELNSGDMSEGLVFSDTGGKVFFYRNYASNGLGNGKPTGLILDSSTDDSIYYYMNNQLEYTFNTDSLDVHNNRIVNLQDPVNPQDAMTLNYFNNHRLDAPGGDQDIIFNANDYLSADNDFKYDNTTKTIKVQNVDTNKINITSTDYNTTYFTLEKYSSGNILQVSNSNGYIAIGTNNSGWAHFYTDRPSYWFNTRVTLGIGRLDAYSGYDFTLFTQYGEAIRVDKDNNFVGINSNGNAPAERLDVNGGYVKSDTGFIIDRLELKVPTSTSNRWLRIASGTGAVTGKFRIRWDVGGQHGTLICYSGCHFGDAVPFDVSIIYQEYYGSAAIPRLRLVENGSSDEMYFDIQISNNNSNNTMTLYIEQLEKDFDGWNMITPIWDPTIPSGYSTHTVYAASRYFATPKHAMKTNGDFYAQRYIQPGNSFKSSDGSIGITTTIEVLADSSGSTYVLTIKDGIITDVTSSTTTLT